MIDEATVVVISEGLSTAELDGEMVVLDVNKGHYYGLNKLGALILEMTQQPIQVGSIIDHLLESFDVDRVRLTTDVLRFLSEMEQRNLVTVQKG